MAVETALLNLTDITEIEFRSADRVVTIHGPPAKSILEFLQHTIRVSGSTDAKLRVLRGDVDA